MKIGFIGCGNMGSAMLSGMIDSGRVKPQDIMVTDKLLASRVNTQKKYGVEIANTNTEVAMLSDIIILAVKPQSFGEVLPVIKANTFDGQVIISLAPGVTVEYLSQETGGKTKIVRTMPNTPAMVGEGMTAVCYGSNDFTAVEKKLVQDLFETVGKMVELPERLMDAAVVANGSSPAFVYIFKF